jgi:anti-sigma regulatory factor (Ser/Thr protein kinase)
MRAELRIPRDPAFVGLARLVVAHGARLAGVAQGRVEDVKIAVAEALAVATVGTGAEDMSDDITLYFGATAAGFEVVVVGLDEPVVPADAEDSLRLDLLDPKLGFTLIEGLTDEFDLEPDGDTMRLRFVVGVD